MKLNHIYSSAFALASILTASCTAFTRFGDFQVTPATDDGSTPEDDGGTAVDGTAASDADPVPDTLSLAFDLVSCVERNDPTCHCLGIEDGTEGSALCTDVPESPNQDAPAVHEVITFIVRASSQASPLVTVELWVNEIMFYSFFPPGLDQLRFEEQVTFDFFAESPTGTPLQGPQRFTATVTTLGEPGETRSVSHDVIILGPPCPSGAEQCFDPSTRQFCPDNGFGWMFERCDFGCQDGRCRLCQPGTATCLSSRTLGTCALDGLSWREDSCVLGCNEMALDCNNCVPGTNECDGPSSARHCLDDGSRWETETCDFGCANGACRLCYPNTPTCKDDRTMATCNSSGTGWIEAECIEFGCISNRCATCAPNTCYCTSESNFAQCGSYGQPSGGFSCTLNGHGSCDSTTGRCTDGFSWCS